MITEGEAAILLETTQRAFCNQSQSKQRSTLVESEVGRWLLEERSGTYSDRNHGVKPKLKHNASKPSPKILMS